MPPRSHEIKCRTWTHHLPLEPSFLHCSPLKSPSTERIPLSYPLSLRSHGRECKWVSFNRSSTFTKGKTGNSEKICSIRTSDGKRQFRPSGVDVQEFLSPSPRALGWPPWERPVIWTSLPVCAHAAKTVSIQGWDARHEYPGLEGKEVLKVLSSIPQQSFKKPGVVPCTYNPSTEETETGLSLRFQEPQVPGRKKKRTDSTWGKTLKLHSGFCFTYTCVCPHLQTHKQKKK